MRREEGETARPARGAGRARHALPECDGGARIVAGARHEDQPDLVGLGFLTPAERQQHADVGAEPEEVHRAPPVDAGDRGGDADAGAEHADDGALAGALGAVVRDRVRDLVTEDGREPGLVRGDRQDARVDADLAAGERPRVHLVRIVEEGELPLPVRAIGDGREAPADVLDDGLERLVLRDSALAQLRRVRGRAELALLLGGDDRELTASGVRHGRARRRRENERENGDGTGIERRPGHRRAAC